MALHTLGGRYAYSNVPYDEWARALTGTSPSEAFGWTRNHYDRLAHFAFGALSVIPVAEIARRWGGLGRHGAALHVPVGDLRCDRHHSTGVLPTYTTPSVRLPASPATARLPAATPGSETSGTASRLARP